jgi:dTDP-4-amino-4,6-dideoxygalactose transaminase
MGRKLGYESGMLPVTEQVSRCIVRLPFYHELGADQLLLVAQAIDEFFR